MNLRTLAATSLMALTMALAGCTGGFDVQQTDPIRVQVEGGPERVEVQEGDPEPRQVIVENPDQAGQVDVEVTVTQTSTGPVTVLISVQDDEGFTLAEQEVRAGGSSDAEGSNGTDGSPNGTYSDTNTTTEPSNETESGPSTTQVIQVDVKGKDSFVVLAQAEEGDADVDIAAQAAKSGGSVEGNATIG